MRADCGADIELRQSKYLNNMVEQDHRAIKRIVRPMMRFKSFRCARNILAGIETMYMIKKGHGHTLLSRMLITHCHTPVAGLTQAQSVASNGGSRLSNMMLRRAALGRRPVLDPVIASP
jgi:hypothetical protein